MSTEQPSRTEAEQAAFYAAVVEAWVATRMEKDRTLLALSAGGIGLLATLLTIRERPSSCELVLYGAAAAAFLAAVIAAIVIFDRNAEHLRAVMDGEQDDDVALVRLDTVLLLSFIVGVPFTAAAAGSAGLARVDGRSVPGMVRRKEVVTVRPAESRVDRSLSGIGKLAPKAGPPPRDPAGGGENTGSSAPAGPKGGGASSDGGG